MPHKKTAKQREIAKPMTDPDMNAAESADAIDPEVKEIFEQAQELDYGRGDLIRKLNSYTDRTPELTGGDVDAAWEYADVGEEAVGGQNPTPDQSLVDEAGEALGVTYNDNEPLRTTEKLESRDRNPYELDPASSPDFSERVQQEFHAPLSNLLADAGLEADTNESSSRGTGKKAKQGKTAPGKNRGGQSRTAKPKRGAETANRARGESHAAGGLRTDISRPTVNNRTTNVARGVRAAPAQVRHKTTKIVNGKTKRG